jgi:hypothetical protein
LEELDMKSSMLIASPPSPSLPAITARRAARSSSRPVRQETRSTGETVLVYEKKTFDSENMNAKDATVLVTFRKDAKSGQLEYWGIEFIPL